MTNCIDAVSFSVIVEWENSTHVDGARTKQMLKTLALQVGTEIREKNVHAELLVVFDPASADQATISKMVYEHWFALNDKVDIKFLPAPNCSYYVLKNFGARHAAGEIIVFVDCDVLPQPDWLKHILQPFSNPRIGVSQGATFVDPHNLLTTGLALAWLFPMKRKDGTLSEENTIIANNIAFRRSVFLEYPYPNMITWRGQCTAQRRKLEECEIGVNWSGNARTIHPFPNGIVSTLERAFLNGHDHVTRYELEGGRKADWKASYWRWRSFLRRAKSRRLKVKSDLALSPIGEFVCTLTAIGYWTSAMFSECMVHTFPAFWRRQLKDLPKHAQQTNSALATPK